MNELQLADDVLARIRSRGEPYHERAYLFILATIEFLQSRLELRRHVTGAELAWACRDFALQQFGLHAGERPCVSEPLATVVPFTFTVAVASATVGVTITVVVAFVTASA